jgi:hypothetical protein
MQVSRHILNYSSFYADFSVAHIVCVRFFIVNLPVVMTTGAQTAIAATTQAAGMTSSANGAMTSQSSSSTTITSAVGAASSVTTQGGVVSSSVTTSALASSTTRTSTGGATSSTTLSTTTSAGNSGNNDNCAGRQCLHNGRAVVLSDGYCYCWCPNNQYIGDLCQCTYIYSSFSNKVINQM